MIKIVINPFLCGDIGSILPEVAKRLDELGIPMLDSEEAEKASGLDWHNDRYTVKYDKDYYLSYYFHTHRHDPYLVKVVEEFDGKILPHDDFTNFGVVIIEVPDGTDWHIVSPDTSGEYVVERHRQWEWDEKKGIVMKMSQSIEEASEERRKSKDSNNE